MRRITMLLYIIILTGVFGCTNFKRLYKLGSAGSKEFYSEFDYTSRLDLIIFPIEINGEFYNFLFDTGAPNVISKELHQKLGYKTIGSGRVGDSQGNKDYLEFCKIESIKIGGVTFENTVAIVADLNHAMELECLRIDGIIGANLMRYAYWKIDTRKKKITISSTKDTLLKGLTNGHSLPFTPQRTFTPRIGLSINDKHLKNVIYDTGAAGYLSLGENAEREKILLEYVGYGSTGLYGANLDTLKYGRVKIELDGFTQAGVVQYSAKSNKNLLGMEFLNQFVQILDWKNMEITLFEDRIRDQKFSRFPISPRWENDQLVIGRLRNDSTSWNSGVVIGDSILEYNGIKFNKPEATMYCDLIFNNDSLKSDTLLIELMNGTKHRFSRINFTIE